jgi:RNA polymerase sigma-70 factor (ECF subfamily)
VHSFESILDAAKAGAEWAWRFMYDEYYATLVGYFRSQGSRDPEALAGDVLLRMSRTVHSFEGTEGKFRSWVFTIAHNRLIDERRSRSRRPEQLEADPPELVAPDSTDGLALESAGTEWVVQALDLLSGDQREVLSLRVIAGFSIPEIATVTGKGEGAVKQLQRRALRRLAKQMEAHPYPNDHSERSP